MAALITLQIETVRPGGAFFNQVTEAVMRGGKILYEDNIVKLQLPDDRFFSVKDVLDILDLSGNVDIFPLYVKIPLDTYKNGIVPTDIAEALGYDVIVEDDEYKSEYTWKDIFPLYKSDDSEDDEENVIMALSTKSEWIKASIAKDIADYLKTELI